MISIIIPVFNQLDMTEECIRAVMETAAPHHVEIVVVDNGSDPAFKAPFSGFLEIRTIRNEENLGFPKAVNQGIRQATGEIVVLLNNDVIVTPQWHHRLADALQEFSIVGPVTNYAAGMQKVEAEPYENLGELHESARGWAENFGDAVEEVNFVIGFCMAFRRSLFDEIGPFDESMWPSSGEEVDFCFRAREKGHRVGIVLGCYVHHEGSRTFQDLHDAKALDYPDLCRKVDAHVAEKWGADYWSRQAIGGQEIETAAGTKKRPYIILAPVYDHTSAGIRALYELRRHLEARGYDALICQEGKAPPDAIVVYPEIVSGNPLGGKTVARLVLNYPGLLGGDTEYQPGELVFAYAPRFYPGAPLLTVPVIEDFFKDMGLPRTGGCFWIGKGKDVPRIPETEGLVEITTEWPKTRRDLAMLFNTMEVFYSYDDCTALVSEARRCGCRVVVIPGEQPGDYDELIRDFDYQLGYFIGATQGARL